MWTLHYAKVESYSNYKTVKSFFSSVWLVFASCNSSKWLTDRKENFVNTMSATSLKDAWRWTPSSSWTPPSAISGFCARTQTHIHMRTHAHTPPRPIKRLHCFPGVNLGFISNFNANQEMQVKHFKSLSVSKTNDVHVSTAPQQMFSVATQLNE